MASAPSKGPYLRGLAFESHIFSKMKPLTFQKTDTMSHRLLDPLEKIDSVYPLYIYDRNRPLAPILRQKMALSDV
jgi:hypothetical protein